jgi:PAS domain S-box-containing protein
LLPIGIPPWKKSPVLRPNRWWGPAGRPHPSGAKRVPPWPENGKWCWFTAAPIKGSDGTIIGAIETLWDKTEDKKAEEEREQHNRELSALCTIYSALNAPADLESRINRAVQELLTFLSADGICIYLSDEDGKYSLHYSRGLSADACKKVSVVDEKSIIHRVAQSNEYTIYEELPDGCLDEICLLEEEKIASLAYVPISSKEKKTFGVIRLGSKKPMYFSHEQKNVLELIGNRIGAAIENAMLQEQYIKSEEKYRTLFNSDPNPIFILSSHNFKILDVNQRAQDSYGYSREELLGLPFLQIGEDTDEELAQGLKNLAEDQSLLFTKKRHYRKGGKPFYVNINMSFAIASIHQKATLPQGRKTVLCQHQHEFCDIRRTQCYYGFHHRYHRSGGKRDSVDSSR